MFQGLELSFQWLAIVQEELFTFLAVLGFLLAPQRVSPIIQQMIGNEAFLAATLNDLWMYNITTGWWMLLSTGNSAYGVYGTKGLAASGYWPGARYQHSMDFDNSNRSLFLFGGQGYAESGSIGI